jgi:hypothetical protein
MSPVGTKRSGYRHRRRPNLATADTASDMTKFATWHRSQHRRQGPQPAQTSSRSRPAPDHCFQKQQPSSGPILPRSQGRARGPSEMTEKPVQATPCAVCAVQTSGNEPTARTPGMVLERPIATPKPALRAAPMHPDRLATLSTTGRHALYAPSKRFAPPSSCANRRSAVAPP